MAQRSSALIMLLLAGLFSLAALAARADSYAIGVLAYRGEAPMKTGWDRLGAYLNAAIPEHRFEIVPVTLTSADAQLRMGALDFLVTNPGHFIALARDHEMSVLASRMDRKSDGSRVESFGSTIIARRDLLPRSAEARRVR